MSIFPDRADLDSPGYLEKRDRISPVMGMSWASAKQTRLPEQERWSRQSDSNRRPADYKSAALPAELCRQGRPPTLAYKAFLNKLSISRTGARA